MPSFCKWKNETQNYAQLLMDTIEADPSVGQRVLRRRNKEVNDDKFKVVRGIFVTSGNDADDLKAAMKLARCAHASPTSKPPACFVMTERSFHPMLRTSASHFVPKILRY